MEPSKIKRALDELTIGTYAYQKRAASTVEAWLKACFKPRGRFSHAISFENPHAEKVTVRVSEKPPSVQLIHYPEGGLQAGLRRMSEKIFEMPQTKVITVEEKDLTRETIILTLGDAKTDEILKYDLLSPGRLAVLLRAAQEFQSMLFIAIHRSIMGIESKDGQKVPFHLIEGKDQKTWDYLETLRGAAF